MRVYLDDKLNYHEDGQVTVTKRSSISGLLNSMTMRFTKEQYDDWVVNHNLIQRALPHLTPDEREFLMTGITPAEWKKIFPPEED